MSEQIRGIILEGQSCAGKTSIFNALKRQHILQDNTERNVIFLAEHYSQILNYVNGGLYSMTKQENLKVLSDRISMLEQLNDYANSMGVHSRGSRGLFFVFERFHLNHAAFYNDIDSDEYGQIERRLLNLNAHTYLLTISDEKVASRLKHREPEKKLTEEEINQYIQGQENAIKVSKRSILPTSIINTDYLKWDEYAKQMLLDID